MTNEEKVLITYESYVWALKQRILEIKFLKKDGTERTMMATLIPGLLPPQPEKVEGGEKEPNYDVVTVWDMDKVAWRSFRIDSVITASAIGDVDG